MSSASPTHYLSRGIDYLGDLAAKLRDLRGYATLANELVQNADDVPGVTELVFDIRDDALVVSNDGVFSDCGHVEDVECPWKDDSDRGYRCDFHRFRFVASGDKRHQPETTGAFGVGFIAVYQITDAPELVSRNRHWLLHEDRAENERIEVCPGCSRCRGRPERTIFYLPWATDPRAPLRQALDAESISNEDINALLAELQESLPTAMIFLKRLKTVEIKHRTKLVRRVERVMDGNSLILSDGQTNPIWHQLKGNFESEASRLREIHGSLIEQKRSADVTVAIPQAPLPRGVLCATLPTQHETGLSLHINADFYPTSDRKRIIFESDFQSQWNRAAISAAAELLAENVESVASTVGHEQLWHIIERAQHLAEEARSGRHDESFTQFFSCLKPILGTTQIIRTTTDDWVTAHEAVLLFERKEAEAIPLLEQLGIAIVHDDLRPFHNLLRGEVGVRLLDVVHMADALERLGMSARTEIGDLPEFLRAESARNTLWRELSALLTRKRRDDDQVAAEARLSKCAIALGDDDALWPCRDLYSAGSEAVSLFGEIMPSVRFVADMGEDGAALVRLCPTFNAGVAVDLLAQMPAESLNEAHESGRLVVATVLRWFEEQRPQEETVRQKLAALPIFPTASGLRPLASLALPGDFTDPIGLSDIVDLQQVAHRREFLRELGARELTFATYVSEQVPRAFDDEELSADKKRATIQLLATRLGELRDDTDLHRKLAAVALVECEDGVFRRASVAYFASEVVAEALGSDVPTAIVPEDHEEAVRELYRWLGVAAGPRISDILRRVEELTSQAPDSETVGSIQSIFEHLGERAASGELSAEQLDPLSSRQWLPARDEYSRWYKPYELYAIFQAYLFDTQASFLDVPDVVQRSSAKLLSHLAVKPAPEVGQVVSHLLECASSGRAVNKEVYRFLNERADEGPVQLLKNAACLLLPDNEYVKPNQVFWGAHPFSGFRFRLSSDLRRYNDLFTQLGVRELPDADDALAVLREIEGSYATKSLDDGAYATWLACWQMLESALDAEQIDDEALEALSERRVIANASHVLNPPKWIFFEDVPGLAAKFSSFLRNNVISRPPGAWHAMTHAGVKSLSTAVDARLAECGDPTRAESFEQVLTERRDQLARVLESHQSGLAKSLDKLSDLKCFEVRQLTLQYSLRAFNRELPSEPEDVPAHLQRENHQLFFVHRDGRPPWNSVARELALLLCPDIEPGRLAPGIKEVLAAASAEEASLVLDELGCPSLEHAPELPDRDDGVIQDLGGDTDVTEPPPATEPPAPSDAESVAGGGAPSTVEGAVQAILGSDAGQPSGMPPELAETGSGTGSGTGTRTGGESTHGTGTGELSPKGKRATTPRPSGGRLRTYVQPEPAEDEEYEPDSEAHVHRTAVEQAGVDQVMQHELREGRVPKEMPPRHKGYDIESREKGGDEVVRYIEVKSISGDWGPFSAGLTRPQFDKGQSLGDRYWLYVVERAEQDDFKIHRIQDPARKVNQFLYDEGWTALREPEASDDEATEADGDDSQ